MTSNYVFHMFCLLLILRVSEVMIGLMIRYVICKKHK